jgi:peptidoglycan/LPS O-acetylase OafA/YrhL
MKEFARRLDFIDYLRGIAVISVFLFHALAVSYGFSMLS